MTRHQEPYTLELTGHLMALKQAVALLADERLFEGWAVSRHCGTVWTPGLAMITNWRIIFLDPGAGISAIPISREVEVVRSTPTTLIITAWHERMVLDFDGPAALVAVKGLLKQAPGWATAGLDGSRTGIGAASGQWRDLAGDTGVTVRSTPVRPG